MPSYDPPSGAGQLWRLISQLSLNYLSLEEDGVVALQEILRLHKLLRVVGDGGNQIGGITRLSARPHSRAVYPVELRHEPGAGHAGRSGNRGERQYVGGGLYLFANVLERFLGCYTSMNSFCQLVAYSSQRKERLGEWLPRAGSKVLI